MKNVMKKILRTLIATLILLIICTIILLIICTIIALVIEFLSTFHPVLFIIFSICILLCVGYIWGNIIFHKNEEDEDDEN